MDYAPSITITPDAVKIFFAEDENGKRWSMQFAGKTPRFRTIYDKNNTALTRDWIVSVHDRSQLSDFARENHAIGVASYAAEYDDADFGHSDASFDAWVSISDDDLGRLINAAHSGADFSGVRIAIKGLTFGIAPDGSEKVWDLASNQTLPVTEFAVAYHLPDGTAAVETKEVDVRPRIEDSRPNGKVDWLPILKELRTYAAWTAFVVTTLAMVLIFR